MTGASLRQKLGCWLNERWRTELILCCPGLAAQMGLSWLDLCNRHERLRPDATAGGRECLWPDSSSLTVARIFPEVGGRLLRHVLNSWPVAFDFTEGRTPAANPQVSILIPIGGIDRMGQFELALAAARAQIGVEVEVIVVEQAEQPFLAGRLPSDVRYIFQQGGASIGGFNKSWALNRAAREASAEFLLLLDADLLLPRVFAAECVRALTNADAVRPARMIFYLDAQAGGRLAQQHSQLHFGLPEAIIANAPMPVALRTEIFWAIGGNDEAYVGWGGEDTEFLDRLRTRRVAEGGWLPVLHAWHAPAIKKADGDRNRSLHAKKMEMSAEERIASLVAENERRNSARRSKVEGSGCGSNGRYLFE